jgi:ribosome biogenesis GTPase / thiamine phosphate phosphatase
LKKLSKRRIKSISKAFEEKKKYHQKQADQRRKAHQAQPLVLSLSDNIEQLVIVCSFGIPTPKPGLIDRLLVVAQVYSLQPILVLNKVDLATPKEVEKLARLYRSLSIPCAPTSATTGLGIDYLESLLLGQSSALCGHSGVGKSSLLQALDPSCVTETGEVSQAIGKGKHTTTRVRLQRLSKGGVLYDLPGLKLMPLEGLERSQLSSYFPDIDAAGRQCRFGDCLHSNEPDCGVKAALENGFLEESRYRSYLKLLGELSGS